MSGTDTRSMTMAQPDFAYRTAGGGMANDPWQSSRSSFYQDAFQTQNSGYDQQRNGAFRTQSLSYAPGGATTSPFAAPGGPVSMGLNSGQQVRHESVAAPSTYASMHSKLPFGSRPASGAFGSTMGPSPMFPTYRNSTMSPQVWDNQPSFSPSDSIDDMMGSPSLSDYSLENNLNDGTAPGGMKGKMPGGGKNGGRSQRRPSNRDEFDGPHQFLQRPPPEYIAMQERELPHLPTNLLVQEQDNVLTQVNDRLSQCAYDFVAKYQFPIPLTQDMRPVERPQDREWTEWVFLLKRLATKRRIPARVLYNGQIKQFVTILENSLEMRHAAKHQSRPLKDDRNILQLISAGIQVAKILKDAQAMEYLDKLYVSTEQQVNNRAAAAAARFR